MDYSKHIHPYDTNFHHQQAASPKERAFSFSSQYDRKSLQYGNSFCNKNNKNNVSRSQGRLSLTNEDTDEDIYIIDFRQYNPTHYGTICVIAIPFHHLIGNETQLNNDIPLVGLYHTLNIPKEYFTIDTIEYFTIDTIDYRLLLMRDLPKCWQNCIPSTVLQHDSIPSTVVSMTQITTFKSYIDLRFTIDLKFCSKVTCITRKADTLKKPQILRRTRTIDCVFHVISNHH